jgi:uncharacterized membrane protein YhaH (DUF805 family)
MSSTEDNSSRDKPASLPAKTDREQIGMEQQSGALNTRAPLFGFRGRIRRARWLTICGVELGIICLVVALVAFASILERQALLVGGSEGGNLLWSLGIELIIELIAGVLALFAVVMFVGAINRRLNDAGARVWLKVLLVVALVLIPGAIVLLLIGLCFVGSRESNAAAVRATVKETFRNAGRTSAKLSKLYPNSGQRSGNKLRQEIDSLEGLLRDGVVSQDEYERMRANLIEKFSLDRSSFAKHDVEVEVVRRDDGH